MKDFFRVDGEGITTLVILAAFWAVVSSPVGGFLIRSTIAFIAYHAGIIDYHTASDFALAGDIQ